MTTGNLTVYRSSAGSGKTFTLVKEYLSLVLEDQDNYRHILAITFTNKAANEMKQRVLSGLKLLSGITQTATDKETRDYQNLLKAVITKTHLKEQQINHRAADVLQLILHNYADFAIGTIDSFFHRVIRTFAFDMHIPANFNVEVDADDMLQRGVDRLIASTGLDEQLTKLLVDYVESRVEDEADWRITQDLIKYAKNLLDDEAVGRIDSLKNLDIADYFNISKKFRKAVAEFEQKVKDIGKQACSLIELSGIPYDAFFRGTQGIGGYFRNIASGRFDKLSPNSYVVSTIQEDKWMSGKATQSDKSAIESIKSDLEKFFHAIREIIEREYQLYLNRKFVGRHIYAIGTLNEIGKLIDAYKQEQNIIHVSEFNRRVAWSIIDQPVPFIYERLGERYRHFLIDEFQDTSKLQWLNLIPLIENGLASGYFSMVVGDGKQAIYRFRNGDVDQFINLPALPGSKNFALSRQREKVFRDHCREEPLAFNYRSLPDIVAFNNDFFSVVSSVLQVDLQRIYSGVAQEVPGKKEGGYVRVEFVGKPDDEDDISAEDRMIEKAYDLILQLQNVDGYHLGDIAILCRNNDKASLVAAYLMENGIDVISAESLLISSNREVRFIIHFLRCLHDPQNKISASALAFHTSPESANKLIADLVAADDNRRLLALLLDNTPLSALMMLSLYELCEAIIRLFELNKKPSPYLQTFLDQIHLFSASHTQGLAGFLQWWDEHANKLSIIVPEGIDAVRIMTIHKAKGLEFPVVIYPFAGEKSMLTRSYYWREFEDNLAPKMDYVILPFKGLKQSAFSDDYEEEKQRTRLDTLNLLYVVMTRAEERLYIFSKTPSKSTENVNTIDNSGKYLGYYLKPQGLWDDERQVYEFGAKSGKRSVISQPGQEAEILSAFPSSSWQQQAHIRLRAPQHWDFADPTRKTRFGKLLHRLLAETHSADELPDAIRRLSDMGVIPAGEVAEVQRQAERLLSDPLVAPFFQPGLEIRTEAEILTPDGTSWRPDRVILEPEKTILIDFKTGQPYPSHREQINRYADLLAGMGYQHLEKYLIYLGDKPVVTCV